LPIGNIEDISLRALKTLKETQFVVCEDSRMFNNLWSKLKQFSYVENFTGRIKFVNDFNEYKVLPHLLDEMNLLEEAVLVSDAGMPLISDPGYKLVSEGLKLGWDIDVVPGPTAESAALAISGLPTDKYFFVGFLPKTGGKRETLLKRIKENIEEFKYTVVIYESAVRTEKILEEIKKIFGEDIRICLAIDITKVSQKFIRGSVMEVLNSLKSSKLKGEVTLLIAKNAYNYDNRRL
jgi:16S rRNA (cytidine1402-2'-O)-methyltransferase